jgi:hypothetical protein
VVVALLKVLQGKRTKDLLLLLLLLLFLLLRLLLLKPGQDFRSQAALYKAMLPQPVHRALGCCLSK